MVWQKLGASVNFSIFSPHFDTNLHLKPFNTIALAFEYACDEFKIIISDTRSGLEAYCPNQTLLEALRCGKKWVRQPIFGYFHHIVAQISILKHFICYVEYCFM